MPFEEIISYSVSGGICFAMAVSLLAVKTSILPVNPAYQRIKKYLAYSALIDVLVDIAVLSLLVQGKDIFLLDAFFIPMAYSAQLYLMTKAIMGLLHTSGNARLYQRLCFIPLALVALCHVVGFAVHAGEYTGLSLDGYAEYSSGTWAKVSSGILYALVLSEFSVCLFKLVTETRMYLKKLNNFYSGKEVLNGKRISYISYCFLGYFLLAAVDFLLSNDSLDTFFMAINTSVFILFVIFISNLQNVYLSTLQLDTFRMHTEGDAEPIEQKPLAEADEKEKAPVHPETDLAEASIVCSVHRWEKREDKPFLKDGVLLADVASELGITDMQLSFILNHSLNVNFNTWINNLRIEESKRMLKDCPERSVKEIAYSAGFPELATFSKVFKKVTGESPSSYRKKANSEE